MPRDISAFFKPTPKRAKTGSGAAAVAEEQTTTLGEADETKDPGAAARIAQNKSEARRKVAASLFIGLTDQDWFKGWLGALEAETRKDYMFDLAQFVHAQRRSHAVFPPAEHVFAALEACPLDALKVVIIGQDPYHGPGQAHGLAFSIADGSNCKFPPSLRNVLAEARVDVAARMSPPKSANSHQKRGWERFTDAVVAVVNGRKGARGVVFLLWGKPAQAKCANIDTQRHRVIASSHPSPLANTKTTQPFTGSRCFSRCNALLLDLGHEAGVDWNL